MLRGRRVELRQLDREDFDAWRQFRVDNAERLEASGPAWPMELDDPASSPAAFERLVDALDRAAAAGLHYAFGVHADEGLIGETQLGAIAVTGPRGAHFGLQLDKPNVGKELSQEIFAVLCRYAFDELGLHRVELAVQPDQENARRAAVKFGLRSEGIAERYLQVGDEWRDHERFVITREEWDARREELLGTWLK